MEGSSVRGVIEGNKIASCYSIGVFIDNGACPLVVGNTVAGPLDPTYGAIVVQSAAPIVANNTVSGGAGWGICLWNAGAAADSLLGSNAISGCAKGELRDGSDGSTKTLAAWRAARPKQSFNVMVAPGQPLHAAVDCLAAGGGRVLLLPGAHAFLGAGVILKEGAVLLLKKR